MERADVDQAPAGPRSIADGLTDVVTGINPDLVRLGTAWAAAVGEYVAKRAIPVRLSDGELRVVCQSAAWTCELQSRESEIVGLLQAHGVTEATRLRCVTGHVNNPT